MTAGMAEYFGIRITSAEKDRVAAELDVDHRHLNGRGVMHGGAVMAFADVLGGHGAGLNIDRDTHRTTTIEFENQFLPRLLPGPGDRGVGAAPSRAPHQRVADLDPRAGRQAGRYGDADPADPAA